MSILYVLTSILALTNNGDTLCLPVHNGTIVSPSKPRDGSFEVTIASTDQREVQSVMAGTISQIAKDIEVDRITIFVQSEKIICIYVLDDVLVKKGDVVQKGSVLGKLSPCEDRVFRPLIFLVVKDYYYVDAINYLEYSR
jgi:hypothetical protein